MHRWSQLFIPTLREAPADAEVASHKFLVRSGYIRQLMAGVYSYLFLGQRSFNKITAIVREEMDKIGQEFLLPALHPLSLWEASGRWPTAVGDNLFRLKDRKGFDLALGMTEEEIMTDIARKELRSYKQLPQIWYQIAPKFRDEPRPRSGLLRVREFIMKDSYSFDIDAAGLDISYKRHYDAYCRIFDRCGLKYMVVEADTGAMGGKESHEFMVRTSAGEDQIVSCDGCDYAANMEKATSQLWPVEDLKPEGEGKPLEVHTPGQKTIEEVAKFLGVSPKNKIKTLALMADEKDASGKKKSRAIIVLMRGDHQLNEAKLNATIAVATRPMEQAEIEALFKSPAGYLGPVGIEWAKDLKNHDGHPILVVDKALEGRTNLIAGANKQDYHLKNLTPGKDFRPTVYADLRSVTAGEACPKCGKPLRIDTAVEIGHIFKLGTRYSDVFGARVLDKNGKEVAPIMGCYGIGIERILTAAVEQNNDENGFWLPPQIAPFDIVVTPANIKDDTVRNTSEEIARKLEAEGYDVLLDDRDERPGVKFKDADLVGIPSRVTVGKKVTEGTVEMVERSTGQVRDVSIASIVEHFHQLLRQAP